MAADRWISMLPDVFDLLLTKADRIVDDTSIEKLLAWIEDVCRTPDGLATFLRQESGALTFLTSSEKLTNDTSCCDGVSFAMRLAGILWSKGFTLDDSSAFVDLFTKTEENESLWSEAVVRNAYFRGLQNLTLSVEGQQWLQRNQGCLSTAVNCMIDSSMFVALAARELIAKFLTASWTLNHPHSQLDKEGSTCPVTIKWILDVLKEKLNHGIPQLNDHEQLTTITENRVSVLDIVRILLDTNFDVGQEILCTSKMFLNCVTVAEKADETVCRKLVDVINGMRANLSPEDVINWDKLLSCRNSASGEDNKRQSAPKILLKILLIWYKRGMIPLALNLLAGLSFPTGTISRTLPPAWPEQLACIINATMAALMHNHVENNYSNGFAETHDSDIEFIAAEMLSPKNNEFDKIERVQKQIQKLVEPWVLSQKIQIDILIQILYAVKDLVTKDHGSYSHQVLKWFEFVLNVLRNSAMLTNDDDNDNAISFALDVKKNVKVTKISLSVVAVLLKQLLHQSSLTDSARNLFFQVLSTAIILARSHQNDPTVITSALECLGVLVEQGSFLILSTSRDSNGLELSDNSSSDMFQYCQRAREDLGSLIHLRLRDQRWEIKDSALELVARLIKTNLDSILKPSILSLVWEAVEENESYVRASAWCCIGHLVFNPALWASLKEKEHLTELAVLKKMAQVLEHESEAFPRRSVMDNLITWSRKRHPIISGILAKPEEMKEICKPRLTSTSGSGVDNTITDPEVRSIYSDIIRHAFKDFDWEVKIRVLQLLESVIQGFRDCRDRELKENRCNESCISNQHSFHTHEHEHTKILMSLLFDLGAVAPLLEAVDDCDSMVCENALAVIANLKDFVCIDINLKDIHLESNKPASDCVDHPTRKENFGSLDENDVSDESKENSQSITATEELQDTIKTPEVFSLESSIAILRRLDVSALTAQCTAADINVQTDPVGFLKDILVAARNHGDNLLDCY